MKRLISALISATLLATPIGLAVAPAATAADCSAIDGCIADATKTSTPKPPPPTPKPKPSGCEATNTCPPDETVISPFWFEDTRWGGAKYFWQGGTVPLPSPYAAADYSGLYSLAKCGPREGFANAPYGTTYNVRAGFWVIDTSRHYYSLYSGGVPIEISEPPVRTYETQCSTYTVESPQAVELTSYGELTINGPYQADGSPMVANGGSLTRDSKGTGTPSVEGKTVSGSSELGKTILKRLGASDPTVLKTALPTAKEAYDFLGKDLGYLTNKPELIRDFGRFYALSERWRPTPMVVYFKAYPQYVSEMFPNIYAQMGKSYFQSRTDIAPTYIDAMTGPKKVDDVQRFKIYCFGIDTKTAYSAGGFKYQPVSGPQPSSYAGLRNALPSMPAAVMDGNWNDNSTTYSYECQTEPPTPTRQTDFLQCDRYDTTLTQPRATTPITFHSETRQSGNESYSCGSYQYQCGSHQVQTGGGYTRVDSGGATYYGNPPYGSFRCPSGWWLSGSTCFTNTYVPPTYTMVADFCTGTNWCQRPTYTTVSVPDATPAGYSVIGSNWVKDCPSGWTTDSTSQCSNVEVGTRIVDRKSAAPLEALKDALIGKTGVQDANIIAESNETISVREPATGDWLHAAWRKPRINVNVGSNAGKDVNSLGASANVKWERRYALTSTSSPVLKGTSVNDPSQPYHLFVDTTAGTTNDRPAADADWVPLSDDGTDDASLNRWVGDPEDSGWEETQRALWMRWFMSSNAGTAGWTVTPWWKVTVTMPQTFDKVVGFSVADDGTVVPTTEKVTEDRRQSYECPGQRLNVNLNRIVD